MLERNLTYLCDKNNFILCYIYKIYLKFRLKYEFKKLNYKDFFTILFENYFNLAEVSVSAIHFAVSMTRRIFTTSNIRYEYLH